MFATHMRPRLEASTGRKLAGMEELIAAANPLWAAVPEAEKREWKEKAKEYRKTEEYHQRKRTFRRRAGRLPEPLTVAAAAATAAVDKASPAATAATAAKGPAAARPLDEEDDYDSDFDPGVPMVRGPLPNSTHNNDNHKDRGEVEGSAESAGPAREKLRTAPSLMPQLDGGTGSSFLEHKKAVDKVRVRSFLLANCPSRDADGLVATMKRCRWLSASAQTFGDVGGRRLPAELAVVEWSLSGGILEEYHRLLGPWTGLSAAAEAAATERAERTHGVPLAGCPECPEFTMSRRAVLRNVLGRVEPAIATGQGLRVGLYKEGLGKAETAVLPGEMVSGRRWLVVVGSEWEEVVGGLRELAESEGIAYEGLPVTPERVVVAEAVAEVLAELAGSTAATEAVARLAGPGRWDDVAEMYCSFHAPTRNPHCALAVARKTLFTLFALLKSPYNLPFYV